MYSRFASARATIDRLQELGLYTKKSLGQHFLVDDNVVGRIIRLADVNPDDTVIEVGPGIGTLTLALAETGARIVAIEYDSALTDPLREITDASQVEIIQADAARVFDEAKHLTDRLRGATKLVANLPYQVAATVVLRFFENLPHLRSATVMVQREVADRMKASLGTKDYSGYTVKLRLLAHPVGDFAVSRASFLPPPRVESTVIRLDRTEPIPGEVPYEQIRRVIDAAFGMRRKTLRNNLRAHFDTHAVDGALAYARIEGQARAETLTPEDFIRLAHALMTHL